MWYQKIWVFNEKHLGVINTSRLHCVYFKKIYIDISPQCLYPTRVCFLLTAHVHCGAVGCSALCCHTEAQADGSYDQGGFIPESQGWFSTGKSVLLIQ